MPDLFSDRLRALKDARGITAQQMSEQTGIPKRTLEKYMLRNGASSPGVEAIRSICSTYQVSADWLLGLSDNTETKLDDVEATEIAAKVVIEHFVGMINHTNEMAEKQNVGHVFVDGKLFGADPADLASDYAYRVLKLRSELTSGRFVGGLTIGVPKEGEVSIKLDPSGVFKTDRA